ncbi:MAG TPA: adenylate/guanylate cyclase domain-containing protein [Anaerolineae bacterium]|nr:adenylate/guanylate cyclase domain-containing protein [Anaerolineae bacterium]
MTEYDKINQAIAHLENQRSLLGDAVVDASIAALRQQLSTLAPKEQRKQVTVLFADLSGFTAMADQMDAEDVQHIINDLWQEIDRFIVAGNGHIDKHLGDGVMALWGVNQTREDDPELAIRTALSMQTVVDNYTIKGKTGQLTLRIGINTGAVLLGEIGTTGEFTAIGDAVNLASRLETAAPNGSILISHDTYQHVRGLFDITPHGQFTFKGKSEPVTTYIINGIRPRDLQVTTRGIEGVPTRMIGRDHELQQIKTSWQTSITTAQIQHLTIVADAGLGKSRLAHEFESWLSQQENNFIYIKGRGRPSTTHHPYSLMRDLFAWHCQIRESDPITVVRRKFWQALSPFYDDTETAFHHLGIIGSWLGYDFSTNHHVQALVDDPERFLNQALKFWRHLITRITQQKSLILLLEDIHWADNNSLQAFLSLQRRAQQRQINNIPLFIISLARPSLYDQHPDWDQYCQRLDLAPLPANLSADLVAELLQKLSDIPPSLLEIIQSRAEGNPFFVEEFIKMLIDNDIIITSQDPWQLAPDKLDTSQIPTTLLGILQSRLDRLSPPQRLTLQKASVVGRTFWDVALTHLNPQDQSAQHLPQLQEKELIYQRQNSAFINTTEFFFRHALLHDVTYEGVLKRDRRLYHKQVATWLSEISAANGRLDEYAARIAHHYEQANLPHNASEWYGRAGQHAAARFAHDQALTHFGNALKMTPKTDKQTQYKWLLGLETATNALGLRDQQAQYLQMLILLSEEMPLDNQIEVNLRQTNYLELTGDYPQTIRLATQIITQAPNHHQHILATAHLHWGIALARLGRYDEATAHLHTALTQARASHNNRVAVEAWINIGYTASHQGDRPTAMHAYEQALNLSNLRDDRHGQSRCLNRLAIEHLFEGHFITTIDQLNEALNINREIGDRWNEVNCLGNLGTAFFILGDFETSLAYYDKMSKLNQQVKSQHALALTLAFKALIYNQLNRHQESLRQAQQAVELAKAIRFHFALGYALLSLGQAHHALGHLDQAKTTYEEMYHLRQQAGQQFEALDAHAGLAHIAYQQNNLNTAQQHLTHIWQYLAHNELDNRSIDQFNTYLICYQLWQTLDDARALPILKRAYQQLRSYQQQLPAHMHKNFLNFDSRQQVITLAHQHHLTTPDQN